MTWYADEILLRATPKSLGAIAAEPALAAHAYHVTSLEGFPWFNPKWFHALPAEGLLVLRPVCGVKSHGAEWHGTRILEWNSLSLESSVQFEPDPLVTAQLAEYLDEDSLPPLRLRRAVAAISAQVEEPVFYYACGMWGGDIDYEYALMYGLAESLCVAKSGLPPDRDGVEDALRVGLRHVGVELPSSFFALHTRDFPWSSYKLS